MENVYTWEKFYAMPFDFYDGAKTFWEPGFDYDDPDFRNSFEPEPSQEFIAAVQMYDWLKKNNPDGE